MYAMAVTWLVGPSCSQTSHPSITCLKSFFVIVRLFLSLHCGGIMIWLVTGSRRDKLKRSRLNEIIAIMINPIMEGLDIPSSFATFLLTFRMTLYSTKRADLRFHLTKESSQEMVEKKCSTSAWEVKVGAPGNKLAPTHAPIYRSITDQ